MTDLEWLEGFAKAVLELDIDLSEFLAGDGEEQGQDLESLVTALVRLHAIKADLDIVYRTLSHAVSEAMGAREEFSIPGATIEKKLGSSRKAWQHDKLKATVIERLLQLSIDEETGEVTASPGQIAEKLLEYAHTDYWRVGKLDSIGINADLYCESGDSKESIAVRKAK